MCMEFPGQVVAVDGDGATVLCEDRVRRASLLLVPDARPGDWVFVAAGTILRRLEPDEAADITTTLRDAIERTPAPAAAGIGGFR